MRRSKTAAVDTMRLAVLVLIAVAVVAAAFTAGCAGAQTSGNGSDAADTPKLKTITVGYENYPPSCYLDEDGSPAGIDMDLATEAFRRIGYKPKFKPIVWTDKDELLASGKIDCIWCCFSMNGREDRYTWAGPYMKSDEVVAVPAKSDIETLADLEGHTVGVAATTEPERVLLEHLNPDAGTPRHVYSLRDSAYLFTSLGKGYVDAIATHRLMVEQYERDYNVSYRILDEPLVTSNVGVAFSKDTTSTVPAELDRVFKKMRNDGTLKQIIRRYVDHAESYLPDTDDAADTAGASDTGEASHA